ncbi:MAG: PadR family transcriptional regulator [Acidimicrobiia bacterium]|nr:PadR family transcriptional regulator [Acidimicrobiia bacterium]MBV8303292.1 PadR family transcriptional regulator [Acidimicrobiia bacterium]
MSTVTDGTGVDPTLNPTAASLLGYLDLGPMTGWDLDRWVQLSIGNFWNVTRSQIYRELRTLTERGYVEAGASGPRDRVPYAITDAGRAAFKEWIGQAPPPEVIRSRLLLTVFFANHLPQGRLQEIVHAERRRHSATLDRYLALEPQLATPDMRFPLATLHFGIRFEHATLEFLDEVEELLGQEGPGTAVE